MGRLTARSPKNGMAYLINVKADEQVVESPYPNTLRCIMDSFQKLGEYEDTGLTPEEIVQLNNFSQSQCAKLLAENERLKAEVERLQRELTQTKARLDSREGLCEAYLSTLRCKDDELTEALAVNRGLRDAVEAVVYRCENHCGVDGNPNWGKDSAEYQFLINALASPAPGVVGVDLSTSPDHTAKGILIHPKYFDQLRTIAEAAKEFINCDAPSQGNRCLTDCDKMPCPYDRLSEALAAVEVTADV